VEFAAMFYYGLSSVQRVAIFGVIQVFLDVMGTVGGISRQKYVVGITPLSEERAKTMVWHATGSQFGWPVGNLPMWIFGFASDRQAWSDYRVFTRGAMITLPLSLASGVINTFARNRVDIFDQQQQEKKEEKKLSLKESFRALRHNRFLIMTSIAGFFNNFIPTDTALEYPIYRFLIPSLTRRNGEHIVIFDRKLDGESIIPIRNQISGTPMTILLPFMGKLVNLCGGPRRYQIGANAVLVVAFLAKYFVGFRTLPAIITIMFIDILSQNLGVAYGYANDVMEYEFLDYVEYKTGVRSEGINSSIRAFFTTVIKNNIDSITTNYFLAWSGITDINIDDPNLITPPRFVRWAWVMFALGSVLRNLVELITRLLLKYDPKDKDMIEAELKQRRELAKNARQMLEEEKEVVV